MKNKLIDSIEKSSVTLKLFAISIVLQIICSIFPDFTEFLAFNIHNPLFPLQLITYQLAHGSWSHLLGNWSFGIIFMLYSEHKLGKKKFLESYLLCGLGAVIMQMCMNGPDGLLIGSSGSIFGLACLSCFIYGNKPIEKILAFCFFLSMFMPQVIMASFSMIMPTGIAYAGHVGGGMMAILLTRFLSKKSS